MNVDLHELLAHNGYLLKSDRGATIRLRKMNVIERLAEIPKEKLEEAVKFATKMSDLWRDLMPGIPCSLDRENMLSDVLDFHGVNRYHIYTRSKRKRRAEERRRRTKNSHMTREDIIETYLSDNPEMASWPTIKRLIDEHDILPQTCASCGISNKWNGIPMNLHIDHVNGDRNDNRLDNLRRLCPNCHSQTDTYCGRNKTSTNILHILKQKKATNNE